MVVVRAIRSVPVGTGSSRGRLGALTHGLLAETLADLVSHPEEELLGIRNLGAKTVELIKEKLQARGLSLKSPE